MAPRWFLTLLVVALAVPAPALAKKEKKPKPPVPKTQKEPPETAEPPLAGWSGVWHTAATVQYSSCPGTVPGHQEAFTLTVDATEKKIVATEQPEQSLLRKFVGTVDQRGRRWVLLLRDKDGKNGMDLQLEDEGRKLSGTRVVVRQARKALCSVVYDVEGTRDEV